MKTIIQSCIRCGESIPYQNVDRSKQIYKCSSCQIISSIITEDSSEITDFQQDVPANAMLALEDDKLILRSSVNKFVPKKEGKLGCLGLFILVFVAMVINSTNFTFNGFNRSNNMLWIYIILIMMPGIFILYQYITKAYNKATFFEITPQKFSVYKDRNDPLYQCPSYMIDKINLRQLELEEVDQGTKDRYILEIQLKDTKLQNVIMQKPEGKEVLEYVKNMVRQFIQR